MENDLINMDRQWCHRKRPLNTWGLSRWNALKEEVKIPLGSFQGSFKVTSLTVYCVHDGKKITFVGQQNKILHHNSKLISLLRIMTVIYFYVLSEYTLWHACNFDMATDKQGQFWQFDLPQFAKLATLLLPWKSGTNFALITLHTVQE